MKKSHSTKIDIEDEVKEQILEKQLNDSINPIKRYSKLLRRINLEDSEEKFLSNLEEFKDIFKNNETLSKEEDNAKKKLIDLYRKYLVDHTKWSNQQLLDKMLSAYLEDKVQFFLMDHLEDLEKERNQHGKDAGVIKIIALYLKYYNSKTFEESDISVNEKKKREEVLNMLDNTLSLHLVDMFFAVLNKDWIRLMNKLEYHHVSMPTEEKKVVEQLLHLDQARFVVSCIKQNNNVDLSNVLDYCDPGKPFFAKILATICCIGHRNCLNVAIERIFREKQQNESPEDFMTRDPAATLFDANFYRRIVEHDRVPLIEVLFLYKDVNWDNEMMKELAEKRSYKNVEAYFKPLWHVKGGYSQKNLDDTRKDGLADKLKAAVRNGKLLELEQCLQDLQGYKKEFQNLDNLINDTVSTEEGEYEKERLMHWACKRGDLAICKALYRKGASLRIVDMNFNTPVHVAINYDNLNVLQWLHECDDTLIRDFFEERFNEAILVNNYVFEEGNGNLPIIEYLLSLGCANFWTDLTIDHVLKLAIDASNDNYSCIDDQEAAKKDAQLATKLLIAAPQALIADIIEDKGKPDQSKAAGEQDVHLDLKLQKAAPRGFMEDIIEEKEKKGKDKPSFKEWMDKYPEALPEILAKFEKIENNSGSDGEQLTDERRVKIQKKIFKEIVQFTRSKEAHMKEAKLLKHEKVSAYVKNNLDSILPYYVDIVAVFIHLLCLSSYCVICATRQKSVDDKDKSHELIQKALGIILVVISGVLIIKQLIELRLVGCKDFLNQENVVETISYVSCVCLWVYVVFGLEYLPDGKLPAIIICIFLSWTDLLMKLKVVPYKLGLYIEMFSSILGRFKVVFVMFLIFIACFSTVFYILFNDKTPFQDFNSLIAKTLAMITGEFDFDNLFANTEINIFSTANSNNTTLGSQEPISTTSDVGLSSVDPENSTANHTAADKIQHQMWFNRFIEYMLNPKFVGYYIFFIFCIFLHILLLNLLNGLAVDDVREIMENSKDRQLIKQAELIVDLEKIWMIITWLREKWSIFCKFCCCRGTGNGDYSLVPQAVQPSDHASRKGEDNPSAIQVIQQNSSDAEQKGETGSAETRVKVSQLEKKKSAVNLEEKPVTLEFLKDVIFQMEKKGQKEREEMTKTMDLMQEVMFQLDKRNRDMQSTMLVSLEESMKLKRILKRVDKRTILIIGGKQQDSDKISDKMLILRGGKWIEWGVKLPEPFANGGAVCLDGEIYIFGGTLEKRSYKLDRNLIWIPLDHLKEKRGGIANSSLEWNGSIWIFGGSPDDISKESLKSVERYDPEENKWIKESDMIYPRAYAAAAVHNGKFFVCGGYNYLNEWKSVEWLDPQSGVWAELKDLELPTPRIGHSLVSYNNSLIIMGGCYRFFTSAIPFNSVLELDILEEGGTWKELERSMTNHRSFCIAATLENEVFLIGGNTQEIEIYDRKIWKKGPRLPRVNLGMCSVVIPQHIVDNII